MAEAIFKRRNVQKYLVAAAFNISCAEAIFMRRTTENAISERFSH